MPMDEGADQENVVNYPSKKTGTKSILNIIFYDHKFNVFFVDFFIFFINFLTVYLNHFVMWTWGMKPRGFLWP